MFLIKKINSIEGNKRKILSNVFWATLGKVVNMFGQLFVGILVARYLGPEQYGIMNYIISYVTLFTIISSFGLTNIEVRELSRVPEDRDSILGTCIRIRFAFATLGYILIILSLIIFNTDTFTSLMILIYGLVLYTGCFELIRNYFTSIIKNEYVVKSEIARTIIGASIKIILLLIKAPLEYFIVATMFDTLLVASGYILSYNKLVGKISNWKYDPKRVAFFIKESFPLLLSGAAVVIYQRIDQVMIGNMIDKESVGYFATASRFLEIILFLPQVLSQTVTPLIVKIKNESTDEEYIYKSKQFVSIVVWISVIMSLIVSFSSYYLIILTYGDKYLPAVAVLQVLAFKTVGMALSSSGGQLIIIEKKQKWAVIRNLFGCIVCISLNLFFIPRYGIIGSAYVTILTVLVSGFLANVLIPPYWHIFKIELYAIFYGWKELKYIKSFIKK